MRPEEQCFSELMEACRSPGFAHAIAMLCFRDNWIAFKGQMTGDLLANKKSVSGRLIRTEITTLIGGLLGGAGTTELPDHTVIAAHLERAESLLEEIHQCMIADALSGFRAESSPLSTGEAIREAVFYATESAYSFQYKDFAEKRYQKDEQWLIDNVGFTLKEARLIADIIACVQSKKAMDHIKSLKNIDRRFWTMLPAFEINLEEVVNLSALPRATVESFLLHSHAV